MKMFSAAIMSLVIAGAVSAQCSALAITGSVNFGQTVGISVTGAPAGSMVFVAAAQSLGSTTFSLGPLGGFSLDIAQPMIILPLGTASAGGSASVSFTMPAAPSGGTIPTVPSQTLHCQSVAIGFPSFGGGGLGGGIPSLGLTFCTSNTTTLQVF